MKTPAAIIIIVALAAIPSAFCQFDARPAKDLDSKGSVLVLDWMNSKGSLIDSSGPGWFVFDEKGDYRLLENAYSIRAENGIATEGLATSIMRKRKSKNKTFSDETLYRVRHYLPSGETLTAKLPRGLAGQNRFFVEFSLGLLNDGTGKSSAVIDICGAEMGLIEENDTIVLVGYQSGEGGELVVVPSGLFMPNESLTGDVAAGSLLLEIDRSRRSWSLGVAGRKLLDNMALPRANRYAIMADVIGEGVYASLSGARIHFDEPVPEDLVFPGGHKLDRDALKAQIGMKALEEKFIKEKK